VLGCGLFSRQTQAELQSATGVVVGVEGSGAAEVTSFSLRTAEGRVITFAVGRLDLSDGGLPAPHLREHLVSGMPITVEYAAEADRNLALRYVDAE
jgi:hypothetical protein